MINKSEFISLFNAAAGNADAELLKMDAAEERGRTASDEKQRRRADAAWSRHSSKHSFFLGQLEGIERALAILGCTVVKNDAERAIDIVRADT